MKTLGYWVDLHGVKLDEGNVVRIQAMKPGKFNHPVYGEIDLNTERFQRFASNFLGRVRGIDLDIDYDHKMDPNKGNRAAGWVRNVEVDETGLYYEVEFTPEAYQAIKNKEYRYFSPEFVDEWEDPETKVKHKDVLNGGALTNRPFLKGMLPINMSEVFGESETKETEKMDELLKLLRTSLNLSEDADEAAIIKALNEREDPLASLRTKLELGEDADAAAIATAIDAKLAVKASEVDPEDAEIKKLAESSPAIAKMLAAQEAMAKRLADQETATLLAETNAKLSDPSLKVVPTVVLNEVKSVMLSNREIGDRVLNAIKKLSEVGFVQLGEIGGGTGASTRLNETANPDPAMALNEAVEKIVVEEKMTYSEALDKVQVTQPALMEAYRKTFATASQ